MCYRIKRLRPLVCLFDSGIGGLNLLKACALRVPYADYFYFADNFNVPYGNLGEEEVNARVLSFFREIDELKPDAAIIACNTVTAECISVLRTKFNFPILGVQPALKQAAALGGEYLVLATEATCKSVAFSELVAKYGREAVMFPLKNLAAEIERNIFALDGDGLAARLPTGNYKSVVLGCTHYIFIKNAIKKRYLCPVFDGMSGTADHLATILGKNDHQAAHNGKIAFFCGDFSKNRAVFEKIKQF